MNLWKSIPLLASLVLPVLGQGASIVIPTNGTDITPGSELVIVVEQPSAPGIMLQVAIVLGIMSCPENACETISPSEPVDVDNVLFSGPWTPMLGGPPQLGFHQNFTVEVPELDSGVALLTLTQLVLIGAGNGPLLLQSGITLNVV